MRLLSRARTRVRESHDLAKLAVRPADSVKLAGLVAAMPAFRRAGRAPTVRADLLLGGESVPWRVDCDADLQAVNEVFRGNEYDVTGITPPEVILDLGSHIGASILFFHQQFPGARIIGAEPDPGNFEKLRENVGRLPRVDLFNVAVGAEPGQIPFYASGGTDSWASSTRRSTSWQREVAVECVTVDGLLERAGAPVPDLLKIDIEGAEYDALRAFGGLGRVRAILGEVHPALLPCPAADFRALLDGFDCDLPANVSAFRTFRATRAEPSQGARASM
jgi:FkbM family methyltransferase